MRPLDWLSDLSTDYGELPPLDDGNKYPIQAAPMLRWNAYYGGYSLTAAKFARIDDQLNDKGMDKDNNLDLVELAIPRIQKDNGSAPPSNVGDTSPGSKTEQQIVMRKTNGGMMHYLLLNGEDNDAVTRGEGHEQPDQLQLLYYVDGTSYLMDTGYDHSSAGFNSSWNPYLYHNTMQMTYYDSLTKSNPLQQFNHIYYQNEGGIESPYVDVDLEHKVSHHNQVDTLYYQNIGDITLMHGTVQLNIKDHTVESRYHRDVLFINAPHPYLVDLNSVETTKGSWSRYGMRYYGNGSSIQSNSTGWQYWDKPYDPQNSSHGQNLYFYEKPVEFDGTAGSGRVAQHEYNEGTGSTWDTFLGTYSAPQIFTTVGFFEVSGQSPAYLPHSLVAYSTNGYTPIQVWTFRQDANTIDVVAKRSKINSTAYNKSFEFNLTDISGNFLTHLVLPAGKDYGFARLKLQNGYWNIDPDYKINLIKTGYSYPANDNIGTYTYPQNADLYINRNSTITITGTVTFQPGTTVHLGKGAVIKTTGSGNIQATGTVFKTLSGSNAASDRWTYILLNGSTASNFTQCTFNGAGNGLHINNATNHVDRCTFEYNSCGIYVWSGEALITGSDFVNNPDYGIYMGGTGTAWTDAYQSGSTFTPTTISGSYRGVDVYDNAWVVLHYSRIDNNTYGAMSSNYARVYAGDVDWSGSDQGWNRFVSNSSYAIYNTSMTTSGGTWTDEARDNWWGTTSPPSYYFYGSVDYGNPLTYDPTYSGSTSQAAPAKLEVMNNVSTNKTSAAKQTTAGTLSNVEQHASDRLDTIYGQLSKKPDDPNNYRLLQEAYSLIQLYDPADSSVFLNKLDAYSGSFETSMTLASNDLSGSNDLQSYTFNKSLLPSSAMMRMGTTAVLLKMDRLLHQGKWEEVQKLADRFAPYILQKDDKSAFLASRAVAWIHQKQFGKALATYQQIDAIKPDAAMSAHYVAPDYSYDEAALQDSMKVYSQAPQSIASSKVANQSEQEMDKTGELPHKFSVGQNYPNPFNPTTVIPVNLPKAAHVQVVVYHIAGQRVATLTDKEYQAGRYQLRFDAHQLASGVYFIRARLGEKTFIRRVTLIK